jgi:hypothetical protein
MERGREMGGGWRRREKGKRVKRIDGEKREDRYERGGESGASEIYI